MGERRKARQAAIKELAVLVSSAKAKPQFKVISAIRAMLRQHRSFSPNEAFPRFLELHTLVHQPSCDYRSAYTEDEELEH